MVRVLGSTFIKTGMICYDYAGLSTDDKPTNGVATGSSFVEVDTGAVFLYDEEGEEWNEVGGSE